MYAESFLLYGAFLVVGYNDEVVAFQFFCTFYNAVHFTLFCFLVAKVIAYLHKTLDVYSVTQDEVHFFVIT